jgi:hypothetical protein
MVSHTTGADGQCRLGGGGQCGCCVQIVAKVGSCVSGGQMKQRVCGVGWHSVAGV